MTIPKFPIPEPFEVTASPFDPPAEVEGDAFFKTDLPGVKLEDLKVKVTGDELFIFAERKKGSSKSVFKRFFTLDEKIDTENLKAFLTDGVLTLTAPFKEVKETAVAVRTFPVMKETFEEKKE